MEKRTDVSACLKNSEHDAETRRSLYYEKQRIEHYLLNCGFEQLPKRFRGYSVFQIVLESRGEKSYWYLNSDIKWDHDRFDSFADHFLSQLDLLLQQEHWFQNFVREAKEGKALSVH